MLCYEHDVWGVSFLGWAPKEHLWMSRTYFNKYSTELGVCFFAFNIECFLTHSQDSIDSYYQYPSFTSWFTTEFSSENFLVECHTLWSANHKLLINVVWILQRYPQRKWIVSLWWSCLSASSWVLELKVCKFFRALLYFDKLLTAARSVLSHAREFSGVFHSFLLAFWRRPLFPSLFHAMQSYWLPYPPFLLSYLAFPLSSSLSVPATSLPFPFSTLPLSCSLSYPSSLSFLLTSPHLSPVLSIALLLFLWPIYVSWWPPNW